MLKQFYIVFFLISSQLAAQEKLTVESPDKKLKLTFYIQDLAVHNYGGNSPDGIFYELAYKGEAIIAASRLGFNIGGKPELASCFDITRHEYSQESSTWRPAYGERSSYEDNYSQLTVRLKEYVSPERELLIQFRMYNEGMALRYSFPSIQKGEVINIVDEFTEFNLVNDATIWGEYDQNSQGNYVKQSLSQIKKNCELPLLAKTDQAFVCVAETGNDNYPRAFMQPEKAGARIQLRGDATVGFEQATPWRVIMVGETAGTLIENNFLLLNLNAPCAIEDTSWIKPGKIIRDVTLSTEGSKRYIDYAASHGIEGVILDWGWYGPPFSDAADATTIDVVYPMTGKPFDNHSGLSIKEVVKYAKSKGVDIWLYVNYQALERQVDELLPLYQSWGISGIKPGFVRVGKQEWEKWLHTIVRKAAKYQLMVDPHDQYRPTGFSRTYPNLMTQEGILGNEGNPDANHNTTLPFTRFVIGAADYTPCFGKTMLTTTFAHRLALPILYYSPTQSLFWAESLNKKYHYAPELELWKSMPTVWDDTKVLAGEPGEYVIIARKSGKEWYVGAITNTSAREIEIPLSFLEGGKKHKVQLYTDDDNLDTPTKVKLKEFKTTASETLSFQLKASGGVAMRIKTQ